MAALQRNVKRIFSKEKLWSYLVILTATRSITSKAQAMKAVVLDDFGGPEKMRIGDVPKPEIKDDHVLIKVHATAVNRADILQRYGKYPPPKDESEIMGLEASGVVEYVGPKAGKSFRLAF